MRFTAVIASGNDHKCDELAALFSAALAGTGIAFDLKPGKDYRPGPGEIDESGDTYEANALIKARAWASYTGLPALADDSGIEVSALDGAPGVHSARAVAGSDVDRISWLLSGIEGANDRSARFVACLVIAFPRGEGSLNRRFEKDFFSVTGTCEGSVAREPRGASGFGYDPVFVPDGYQKSFAELGAEVKMQISHRAIAVKCMAQLLPSVIKYLSHCAS